MIHRVFLGQDYIWAKLCYEEVMRVRIYPLALGKVIKHTLTTLNKEVAGLLVGKYIKKQDILEIWDAITGEQKATSAFVYLEEEIMAVVAEWLMHERPGLYIVGWYHSHPGFDLFLSTIDIETQKRYQLMFPKAVAMVVDPVKYAQTRRLRDLKFKVFRLNRRGDVVEVRVSIGIHRRKVIESTIQGMETVDLRFIRREIDVREAGIGVEEQLDAPFSPISEVIEKIKRKLSQ